MGTPSERLTNSRSLGRRDDSRIPIQPGPSASRQRSQRLSDKRLDGQADRSGGGSVRRGSFGLGSLVRHPRRCVRVCYRPGFWYYGHYEYALPLVPLVAVNGLTHFRLLAKGSVTWRWLFLLSAMDITVFTVGVIIQGGFGKGFIFLAYYPALALFVLVFTSSWLGLAWTTMTAGVYTLVCLKVGPGLDFVAGHEKELLVRVAAMYALVLYVGLVTRFERTKRQAAVERERALHRERVELSQSIPRYDGAVRVHDRPGHRHGEGASRGGEPGAGRHP